MTVTLRDGCDTVTTRAQGVPIRTVADNNWRMAERDQDITDHLDWCKNLRGLTPATLRARAWVLNRFRVTIDRPVRDAEIGHVLFWEQTVVHGLAPQSRRAYCAHVRALYRWLIATDRISSDPSVMLTRPKIGRPLPSPISESDLKRAMAAASPKLAAMMALMADAGLRCLEVGNLLWSDIQANDGETWLTVRNGKGGRDRVVPLGLSVQRALRRHGTKTRGPVFLGRDGRQLGPNSVTQTVNYHLRKLGIESTAHKLRARYATQAGGVLDTPLVAQLCGWESLNTARHYIRPDRERSAKLVAALDALSCN